MLDRSTIWRGLLMKAENAVPLVPGMTECTILERRDHGFLRRAIYRGEVLVEEVRLTPEIEVRFERVGSPGDWVTNVISDGPDGLLLTFTVAVVFDGVPEGSPDEAARGAEMRGAYVEAIEATLATVRGSSNKASSIPPPSSTDK